LNLRQAFSASKHVALFSFGNHYWPLSLSFELIELERPIKYLGKLSQPNYLNRTEAKLMPFQSRRTGNGKSQFVILTPT
jgi:hypothetical protein